jgi:hypothetical protein
VRLGQVECQGAGVGRESLWTGQASGPSGYQRVRSSSKRDSRMSARAISQ